ncbi:MAG: 8-amino-7-oxononanoate synthase [Pelotomaculum sp. PtaB.Bin013]|uniref:8-amino-7-ketopelargonate synthase n=1 Tax=Pelotomaculum isophthalicicum JI TaxID=947010 RepID=A0A9X4GYS5_9FIRM|nr:8-amino-7-oxononanoate synthase [Pelotomaculum isophthalicicum]MDF9408077.1 8-amino-7-oxononanoate synthase [Pelotomaculum isophthalicicum JI]OPX92289.1 MAG: 8-amino-7-oxononanoate synthase [Pelotomaculum sp. PtaB.Bin013]
MNFVVEEMEQLLKKGYYRQMRRLDGSQASRTVIGGKECVLLSSNNYLGLTEHPEVKEAAKLAVDRWGAGSGGSRLITGNYALHEEMEKEIARFKREEGAITFSSGYMANFGVIQALVDRGDVVLSDELNHSSIVDGCRLSRAKVKVYRHRDMEHLEKILRQAKGYRRRLIVTDGVFSMDGDLAPLPDIVALAGQYGAFVMVDDAHGTGVLGRRGAGTVEHFGLEGKVQVQMGTLSKALGSAGAYVAGKRELIDYLRNKTRSFIYSTAPAPAAVGAALAALRLVERQPEIRAQLWENARYLRVGLKSMGYKVPSEDSPIIPVLIGDADKTMHLAQALLEEGVFAPGIRPPTVPQGTCRIRATVMAIHTRGDLDQALSAFARAGRDNQVKLGC